MSTASLSAAIAATRDVLAGVSSAQLSSPTPCEQWDVAALINHIVGGQYFFAGAAAGSSGSGEETDYAAGDFVASFDDSSSRCLAAFSTEGVMDQMLTMPWGAMPAAAVAALAATDTFTHAWDLARATNQSTDLDPELAAQLLEGSRANISAAFRNESGSPFGFEQSAPGDASVADQLAAFLGRRV